MISVLNAVSFHADFKKTDLRALCFQLPPIDLYRKRIGRQDSRKEKGHLKEVKKLQEAKEGRGIAFKDSVTNKSYHGFPLPYHKPL